MSDREAHRFDHLSDGHLADKAAYGDSGAFVALADRFHDEVWTVAALASGDEGTATRATARAFTRTLAGVAAGISDPDACVERALVGAAFELAVTARIDGTPDLVEGLPAVLVALDPATRVALWLGEAKGWSRADAVEAVSHGVESGPLDAVPGDAPEAIRAVALTTPAGLATATAEAWHEWQGIGLTIPERHPLTTVLSRLDAPLGRMGDAIGRAGARAADRSRASRATRRRTRTADRAPAAVAAAATPPPADHLPIEATPEPAADAPVIGDLDLTTVPVAAPVTASTSAEELEDASGIFFGPRNDSFDMPERRPRPRTGGLVTAYATPTRTRILAALAAGILTASAMGSLLSASPTDLPGSSGGDQVAAGSPSPEAGSDGALLDDSDLVPAAAVSDEAATETSTTAGASPTGVPTADRTGSRTGGTGGGGSDGGGSGSGGSGSNAGPSGSGGSTVSPGVSGGNGGGGSAPTPTTQPSSPSPTTQPAAPTTSPPPTTQPAPPTTTPPPTTQPPGPVCTLLPVLCPGGGLVP